MKFLNQIILLLNFFFTYLQKCFEINQLIDGYKSKWTRLNEHDYPSSTEESPRIFSNHIWWDLRVELRSDFFSHIHHNEYLNFAYTNIWNIAEILIKMLKLENGCKLVDKVWQEWPYVRMTTPNPTKWIHEQKR